MSPSHSRKLKIAAAEMAFLAAVLLVAAFVFREFIRHSNVNFYGIARVEAMIDGTASRPFVFRRLVPDVASLLAHFLPEQELIAFAERTPWVSKLFQEFYVKLDRVPEHVAVLFLMYAALVVYAYGLRDLWNSIYLSSPTVSALVALTGPLLLFVFFGSGYIYDFATLALFTLALAFLARGCIPCYLVAYTLSMWNRETTLLLLPVYCLTMRGRMPRARYWTLAWLQAFIFVAVYAAFSFRFRGNPGGPIERANLAIWLGGLSDFRTLLPVWVLLAVAIGWKWMERPTFLCQAAVMFPPLLVAYFIAGRPGEIRVFYEVLPVLTLLLAANCLKAVGKLPPRSASHESPGPAQVIRTDTGDELPEAPL